MPNKLKFLSDEHIDLPAVEALKGKGTDIVSIKQLGLLGSSDEEILKFANSQRRVIITRDKDFLVLHSKGHAHQGIAFLTSQLGTAEIIREIELLEILFNQEDAENSVLYIPQRH